MSDANRPAKGVAGYRIGDCVYYHRIHGDACPATILNISAKGRLSLNVHQGGAVPYYTATGVKVTAVSPRGWAK